MIDLNGATKYFKTTTFFERWGEFAPEQKTAAIEMAKREFARAIGRELKADAANYKAGDRVCEEYAAYEQAFYTLLRDTQPNAGGSPVPALDQDDQKSVPFTLAGSKGQWSPRALAWLGGLSVVTRMGS